MAHVEMAMIDERNRTKLKERIAGQRELDNATVVVKERRIGIGFHKLRRVESFCAKAEVGFLSWKLNSPECFKYEKASVKNGYKHRNESTSHSTYTLNSPFNH